MLPVRNDADHWDDGLPVLVPGLMGFGFLVSLIVLLLDGVEKVLPASSRRRAVRAVRIAQGRHNDIDAVRTGRAPRPGDVFRLPRGRLVSLFLALVTFGAAVGCVVGGIALAANVGEDREAWAIGWGVGLAVPLGLTGLIWLAAAVRSSRPPEWLLWLHRAWPLGRHLRYPSPIEMED